MSNLHVEFNKFLSVLNETPQLWHWASVRLVAVDTGSSLENLFCVIALLPGKPSSPRRRPPATAHLRCFEKSVAIENLELVFAALKSGVLKLGSNSVNFFQGTTDNRAPYQSVSVNTAVTIEFGSDKAERRVGHLLSAYGDGRGQLFNEIGMGESELGNELRRLDRPWDGLDGLAEHFLGRTSRGNHQCFVEVVAPLDARFSKDLCRMRSNEIVCGLECSTGAVRQLRLTCVGHTLKGRLLQRSIAIPKRSWKKRKTGLLESTFKVAIPAAKSVSLFLAVSEFSVDRIDLAANVSSGVNSRVVGYQEFDPELALLTAQLRPPQGKGENLFEKAVARLFHLCGFATDSFAFEDEFKNAPDLIVYSSEANTVFVTECTTGPLASHSGKLNKLIARTNRFRKSFPCPAPAVHPVIVSSLARQDLSASELRDAGLDEIIVLTQDDFQPLIDLARNCTDANTIASYFRSKIPLADNSVGTRYRHRLF
ncbi:MAG: hypothetical protein H0W69_00080 [Gemmatimonadaceae bacterium]|nr:hypothetical protein [Gemmatimonadaceae bacterium]